MKLLIDILQGMGVAAAAGVRPFLPAFVTGAAGRADLLVDFDGTDFAFLEHNWWLAAMAVLMVAAVLLRGELERPAPAAALQGIALGIGGVLFAGFLASDGYVWWPGIPAGILCTAITAAAARGVFSGAATRLDESARAQLPLYAEGIALLLAVLAILVPPVSLGALGAAIWLIRGARRRAGEKYAGLRILR